MVSSLIGDHLSESVTGEQYCQSGGKVKRQGDWRGFRSGGGRDYVEARRSHRYAPAIASVANVTGTPTLACRRQSMRRPRRSAASTTMMFAMLPTISRFPESVLTSASSVPAIGCVASGSSSMTAGTLEDRKSTRLNSSHSQISYAVFCLKKK